MNILTDEVLRQFLVRAPELTEYMKKVKDKMVLEPQLRPIFEYLASAIVYQQITGKAAASIEKRLLDKIGSYSPENVLKYNQEDLRECGLSRQKALYMHTLSQAFMQQDFLALYDSPKSLEKLQNEEIIKLISKVKGIGSWTVRVMLIFNLGRLNVLAEGDLGVQKGIEIMYRLENTPKPKEVRKITSHWGDLATVGSFLAWRILHFERGDE